MNYKINQKFCNNERIIFNNLLIFSANKIKFVITLNLFYFDLFFLILFSLNIILFWFSTAYLLYTYNLYLKYYIYYFFIY